MNGVKHSWEIRGKGGGVYNDELKVGGGLNHGGGGGETHPADEALGVPEGVQGRDVVLQDGSGTAATLGGKHVEVVLPAERLPVLLMEACQGQKALQSVTPSEDDGESMTSLFRRLMCHRNGFTPLTVSSKHPQAVNQHRGHDDSALLTSFACSAFSRRCIQKEKLPFVMSQRAR